MSAWLVLALCLVALAVTVAPIAHSAIRARRAPRPLPHRPAHGTPPAAGARHRVQHAHTGSISAAEILRALNAQDDQ